MLKRLFLPVLLPSLLFSTGVGATVPVTVLAALQLGASEAFASALLAVAGVISLLFTVPAGAFIDRVGDRRAMLWATSAAVVITALTVTSLTWQPGFALGLYACSLFLRAPVEDVWRLARQSYIAQVMPAWQVGKSMTALGGTMRVGNLLGPLMGAGLLLALPIWSVFAFSALCAVGAVIVLFLPAAEVSPADSQRAPRAREAGAGASAEVPARSTLSHVRWGAVALASVPITLLMAGRVAQPIVLQLWGVSIGLSESTIAVLAALGAAVELIIMFPAGWAKDRIGRAFVLISCMMVFGAGFLAVVLLPTLGGLGFAVVVMAIGNGLGAGINMTIGADLAPTQGWATFFGIWAIFTNAGFLGGPVVISALVASFSLTAAVATVGWLILGGAAWMAVFARTIGLPKRLGPPTEVDGPKA